MARWNSSFSRSNELGTVVTITLKDLTKRFDDTLVLDHINLEIRANEFLGLLGPSGSGKTTILRILAGLEIPDSGTVAINEQDALSLPLIERQMGFVFQHYALFEHMSVFENVAFGLRVRPRRHRPSDIKIRERVTKLLELVQLEGMEERFPSQLSGGQRQRVALARARATEPKVLLLDEPFGALDAKVRIELRRSLRDIHDGTKLTTVFVTHDQEEALDLADRIAIINRGKIEQIGTPTEVYEESKTPFVFDFLGRTNAFKCDVVNGTAKFGNRTFPVDSPVADGPAVAFVRPNHIQLLKVGGPSPSDGLKLPGTAVVRHVSALGPWASIELRYERQVVECELMRDRMKELGIEVGSKYEIGLRFPRIFERRGAERDVGVSVKTRTSRLRFRRNRKSSKGR
jgi:sulfate transport system ATP-binding protein